MIHALSSAWAGRVGSGPPVERSGARAVPWVL